MTETETETETDEAPRVPITIELAIAELERELSLRRTVYPRLVERHRLDEDAARRQFARLRAAREYLRAVRACKLNRVCCDHVNLTEAPL